MTGATGTVGRQVVRRLLDAGPPHLGRPKAQMVPRWSTPWLLGMPIGMVLVTTAIYTAARLGQASGLTDDVSTVLGRPPVSFEEFARRERGAWTPHPSRP